MLPAILLPGLFVLLNKKILLLADGGSLLKLLFLNQSFHLPIHLSDLIQHFFQIFRDMHIFESDC